MPDWLIMAVCSAICCDIGEALLAYACQRFHFSGFHHISAIFTGFADDTEPKQGVTARDTQTHGQLDQAEVTHRAIRATTWLDR